MQSELDAFLSIHRFLSRHNSGVKGGKHCWKR